jgi:hypothetical protein
MGRDFTIFEEVAGKVVPGLLAFALSVQHSGSAGSVENAFPVVRVL